MKRLWNWFKWYVLRRRNYDTINTVTRGYLPGNTNAQVPILYK